MSVSVIIGFRNWGLDRLAMCIESLRDNLDNLDGEIIVSDYGSDNQFEVKETCDKLGAKYLYTESDVWSRSRALNAGIRVSKGDYLVFTDADMVFLPSTLLSAYSALEMDPNRVLLLQCRDLPPSIAVEDIRSGALEWSEIERVSRLRPRWGMGGFVAGKRTIFEGVRGLDERMQTYGGEDIDLIQRLQRDGIAVHWHTDPDAKFFHVWHAKASDNVDSKADYESDVNFNRNIVYKDPSFVRNVEGWHHSSPLKTPTVSVVIATHNRPEYLREAIQSCLYQTMRDIEVIVVSDGPDPKTDQVIAEFEGYPVTYEVLPRNSGVAAVRNRGTDLARGAYIAVLDDDDLMPPWRLSAQLMALRPGDAASFGSFVNFTSDKQQIERIVSQEFIDETAFATGGAPGHGTLLVRREVLEVIRYDENLVAGIDNDFFMRALRSGVQFSHCGQIVLLRRMHGGQITGNRSVAQLKSAASAHSLFQFNTSKGRRSKIVDKYKSNSYYPTVDLTTQEQLITAYLDDSSAHKLLLAIAVPQNIKDLYRDHYSISVSGSDLSVWSVHSWDLRVQLRANNVNHVVLPIISQDDLLKKLTQTLDYLLADVNGTSENLLVDREFIEHVCSLKPVNEYKSLAIQKVHSLLDSTSSRPGDQYLSAKPLSAIEESIRKELKAEQ